MEEKTTPHKDLYKNAQSTVTHNSLKLEPKLESINSYVDKQIVLYSQNTTQQ